MNFFNHNTNLLSEDINKSSAVLEAQRGEREHNKECIILQSIVDSVETKKEDIGRILSMKNPNTKALKDTIVSEIVRAVNGNLTVTNYCQRVKAEQNVYLFTGTHWILLDKQLFKDFINEAAKKIGTPDIDLHDYKFMNTIYELVSFGLAKNRNPYVPVNEAWINFMNGTLEIKGDGTFFLREHNRDDFFLYSLDYNYDPKAECPQWHHFLDQMLPQKDAQDTLASYIGYCFTRNLKLEKMLVLYGGGSNGKSVVLDTISNIFGSHNISNISLADLTNDDEKRSHIDGKLLNISHESNKELDASVLKRLVSGEPIDARELYVGTRTIKHYAKLATSFNILPKAEATHGFYRRFVIIPFMVTIEDSQADVDLSKKLSTELPGILNWILKALSLLMKTRKLPYGETCKQALDNYKLNSDSVRLFIHERIEKSEDSISSKELYRAYTEFCNGEGLHSLGRNTFLERFESNGYNPITKQRIKYYNVKVNSNEK